MGMFENTLTPGLFIQGMVVALILGAAGGLYPAWRAAQLLPVEAMRYDGSAGKSQTPNLKSQLPTSNFQSLISKFGGMAVRNVFRQRTRTLLTTLAIGVGVGMVVALGGIADGFVDQLGSMGSASGELTITETKASDMSLSAIDDKVGRFAAGLAGRRASFGHVVWRGECAGHAVFFRDGTRCDELCDSALCDYRG